MKTDLQIQRDVIAEIKWDPSINAPQIGVAVKNGIVTLSGRVGTYTEKLNAESAAKRVSGVKVVAEDIQINLSTAAFRSDTEIAEAVFNALKWHSAVLNEKIKIKVENGVVTLDGEVEWDYQRTAARKAVMYVTGVKSIANMITIKPTLNASDIQNRITAALKRKAGIDATKIEVSVSGNRVILDGNVRSFAEIEDASDAAWAAPGVQEIVNNLTIEPSEIVIDF